MSRSTFKVLFYMNGSKEKDGIVPIMGRVTINGTVSQFSCKQSIPKTLWDVKGNKAKGKGKEARDINLALDNIKAQIIKHYQRISDREAFVTAEIVRNAYQGIGSEYETLIKAFDKNCANFLKRVGKDRTIGTYKVMVRARNYVAAFVNIEREEFIRVGTTLYKLVNQPRLNGGYVKKRIPWNAETLRQDYGKGFMASVPKYDGFCTVPNHVDYKPVVDKFLNLYEPIGHQPMQGDFPHIRSLVQHIFGEQYELGMDYLQLLYLQPVQKLPILLLVSEERNTGKSTFLNFLKAVFQD